MKSQNELLVSSTRECSTEEIECESYNLSNTRVQPTFHPHSNILTFKHLKRHHIESKFEQQSEKQSHQLPIPTKS
jgi:hypothetical protein